MNHTTTKTKTQTIITIKNKTIINIDEFGKILNINGYSLKDDLYIELLLKVPIDTKVESIMEFFKQLQETITTNTTCMFNFEVTDNKSCLIEVVLK
jgi:hypothetical protein